MPIKGNNYKVIFLALLNLSTLTKHINKHVEPTIKNDNNERMEKWKNGKMQLPGKTYYNFAVEQDCVRYLKDYCAQRMMSTNMD